jgi:hypothetical protein
MTERLDGGRKLLLAKLKLKKEWLHFLLGSSLSW